MRGWFYAEGLASGVKSVKMREHFPDFGARGKNRPRISDRSRAQLLGGNFPLRLVPSNRPLGKLMEESIGERALVHERKYA